jgi:ferredoxin
MTDNPYKRLATRLDALPNGFPATADGAELRLLKKLFLPEEAALASELRLSRETPKEINSRLGDKYEFANDTAELRKLLKGMARKGLIAAGRSKSGLNYGLMPFVVGIYEMQAGRIDTELAQLFEDYYQQAFVQALKHEPAFHRVIPVRESIQVDMEIQPFESASAIVNQAQAWGVMDCICRKQKELIGDPCEHPIDVCMILGQRPGSFDNVSTIEAISREKALETLRIAAEAGLVHSISNKRDNISYICNCCTCSCGILRGMSELGIANVVARSAFVNHVDDALCFGCEICLSSCQFDALSMGDIIVDVNEMRCVGCGVCVPVCPEDALSLVRRSPEEQMPIPANESEWLRQRATHRKININEIL